MSDFFKKICIYDSYVRGEEKSVAVFEIIWFKFFFFCSKQTANKPVNGTSGLGRGTPSPKPNLNGNGDVYRYVFWNLLFLNVLALYSLHFYISGRSCQVGIYFCGFQGETSWKGSTGTTRRTVRCRKGKLFYLKIKKKHVN